jgi:hypothetical protein
MIKILWTCSFNKLHGLGPSVWVTWRWQLAWMNHVVCCYADQPRNEFQIHVATTWSACQAHISVYCTQTWVRCMVGSRASPPPQKKCFALEFCFLKTSLLAPFIDIRLPNSNYTLSAKFSLWASGDGGGGVGLLKEGALGHRNQIMPSQLLPGFRYFLMVRVHRLGVSGMYVKKAAQIGAILFLIKIF